MHARGEPGHRRHDVDLNRLTLGWEQARNLPRLLLQDQRLDEPNALPALGGASARAARDPGLRFLDVLGPLGIGDELRVPLRDKRGLWGCLDLMRSSDERPFTEQDVAFVDTLAPLLAAATRRSAAAAAAGIEASPSPEPGTGDLSDAFIDVQRVRRRPDR